MKLSKTGQMSICLSNLPSVHKEFSINFLRKIFICCIRLPKIPHIVLIYPNSMGIMDVNLSREIKLEKVQCFVGDYEVR